MQVIVDGQDLSGLFNKTGFTEQAVKQLGSNTITTLAGKRYIDLRGIKNKLVLVCNDLISADREILLQAFSPAYVNVAYNIRDDTYRIFMPSGSDSLYTSDGLLFTVGYDSDFERSMTATATVSAGLMKGVQNGLSYWNGITVTLEEQ